MPAGMKIGASEALVDSARDNRLDPVYEEFDESTRLVVDVGVW